MIMRKMWLRADCSGKMSIYGQHQQALLKQHTCRRCHHHATIALIAIISTIVIIALIAIIVIFVQIYDFGGIVQLFLAASLNLRIIAGVVQALDFDLG